jgi:hypothetical protein
MNKGTLKTVIYVAAGLGAVYLAYLAWQKFKGGVQTLTAPVINPLADWYASLTSQGQAIPQGFILLPNGNSVSSAALTIRSVPNSNSAQFAYNGQTYYLNSPHDDNGNWLASTSLGG